MLSANSTPQPENNFDQCLKDLISEANSVLSNHANIKSGEAEVNKF